MLGAFAAYLAVHFAAYVLVLRRSALFRTEKGIFFYHFASAFTACTAALVLALLDQQGFGLAGFVIVLSVHGIYSVSFLELWSLAQGGYSLSVIAEILRAESAGTKPDFSALARIGEGKQQDRIAGLEKIGVIVNADGKISLTESGNRAVVILSGLLAWVDPKGRR